MSFEDGSSGAGALLPHEFGACPSVGSYRKVNRIGEGTYGYVYRAVSKSTQEVVALKRIILHNEHQDGFPITSLREIKTLRACRDHPNIVRLHDVCVGSRRDAVFLVFEYCEHDLATITKVFKKPFTESEVKCLVRQLLCAVQYVHRNWIVHRDIKLPNLLYNSKGQLKLADFGLARALSHPAPENLTQTVVTLWYRAPELLLGSAVYSFPIDIWSVGCILGELLLSSPLLPGSSELDQMKWIFHLLGEQ
jgi:serine/threonine protein kinase